MLAGFTPHVPMCWFGPVQKPLCLALLRVLVPDNATILQSMNLVSRGLWHNPRA